MAFIKFKELTKYFYFYQPLDIATLPDYVHEYITTKETIIGAYATSRDKVVFTDKKMILFDVGIFTSKKQMTLLPYASISSSTILFRKHSAFFELYMSSGYPVRFKFVKLKPGAKKKLKEIYMIMNYKIMAAIQQ